MDKEMTSVMATERERLLGNYGERKEKLWKRERERDKYDRGWDREECELTDILHQIRLCHIWGTHWNISFPSTVSSLSLPFHCVIPSLPSIPFLITSHISNFFVK